MKSSHHPILLLAICFVLAFLFATTWVVVMALLTNNMSGQLPFSDPLVLPIMSIFATVAALVVFPFTYFSLRDRHLPKALFVLVGMVVIEIVIVTPINFIMGFFGAFIAYAIGLVVARRASLPSESRYSESQMRFSLRSLFIGVTAFALLTMIVVKYQHQQNPYTLINAAEQGDIETVRHLLAKSTSVDAHDGWSGTALMYSSAGGHLEIVKLLLAAGATIDEQSRLNRTPIMHAARLGKINVVEYLAQQGADLDVSDEDGQTALDLAATNGHTAVVAYLEKVIAPVSK